LIFKQLYCIGLAAAAIIREKNYFQIVWGADTIAVIHLFRPECLLHLPFPAG